MSSSSTYQNNFQFHYLVAVAQQIPKFFCKSPINFGMCASFASFQLGLSFLIHIKTTLLGNMSGSQEAAARCCKCNAAAVMQSKKDVPQTLDSSFLDLVSGSVSILLIGLILSSLTLQSPYSLSAQLQLVLIRGGTEPKFSVTSRAEPVTKRTLPLLNVLSMRHIFSSRYWSKYSYEQQMKIFW